MESKTFYEAHKFFLKPFVAWIVWMLVGTVFYAYENEMGWAKGFYMAVNVGYSIGWGFPVEINEGSRFFSTVYVLVGASAVAAALGFFGQSLVASSKEWYNEALLEAEKRKTDRTRFEKLSAWIARHDTAVKTIGLWVVWISSMILFSCVRVKWTFIDGLYFAVSSLSTGGLHAIPSDSPDWYFGIVGLFSCTGIPLMGMAMGHLAGFLISIGDPDELRNAIRVKVTKKELLMMKRFGLDDGDGKIDRGEFILLSAVRIGALSPDLVETIVSRFDELDMSGDGTLDYDEILETAAKRKVRTSVANTISDTNAAVVDRVEPFSLPIIGTSHARVQPV